MKLRSISWKVWLLGVGLFGGAVAYVTLIQDFLAINRPVAADVLVLESWIWNKDAVREAAVEFRRRPYRRLVCVGGMVKNWDGHGTVSPTAEFAAQRLIEWGVPADHIAVVTISEAAGRRTVGAAMATRVWLTTEMPDVESINVFTLGVHARKSHLFFTKVFGPAVKVGVIAGLDTTYPPDRWWTSVPGTKLVFRNTFGYLYALIWPQQAD